jgi:hypothetical protein
MRFGSIIALFLALTAMPVGAAMYKWKDANGNVQYGEFPPAGATAEQITPSGAHKSAPQASQSPQERLKALEEQQQKQGEEEAKQAAESQQAEQKKKNCEIARKNLATLQAGGNRRIRLPDGTVTHLTDEDRQSRIAEAQEQIKSNCD